MYLNKVEIKNYGQIENCIIEPEFHDNGSPKPLIVVGKNGAGKTLLLSHLVDSLIEIKKKTYRELPEIEHEAFYKIGKKNYIGKESDFSYVSIDYGNEQASCHYLDVMSTTPENHKENPQGFRSGFNYSEFEKNGFFKEAWGNTGKMHDNFICLYLPTSRYYNPAWLNSDSDKCSRTEKRNNVGVSVNNIIKENVISDIERWVADVLLDRNVYERVESTKTLFEFKGSEWIEGSYVIDEGFKGKNTNILRLLNRFLGELFRPKYKNLEYARIGLSPKQSGRNISIIVQEYGSSEVTVAPTFQHLSSGEAMLISMFASIVKDCDYLTDTTLDSLDDIKGIVIIDEIDLNLHIEYAKDVLPNVIKMFKNVQFVITTHSPFFLMGMKEYLSNDNYTIASMPSGTQINERSFSEH